jgi:NTP pyrophosphatase (non-canonical NTP hydrolase)
MRRGRKIIRPIAGPTVLPIDPGALGITIEPDTFVLHSEPSMADRETTVQELRDLMAAFVAERQWEQFHDPKNLAASIAIETAELMEHFQWLRTDELAAVRDDSAHMAKIREEVADVFAYLLSFANSQNIDLADALREKMKHNSQKYPAEDYRGRFRK